MIKILLNIEYLALIISCYLNAYMFWRTKNGVLRKLLIWFFLALATAALARAVYSSFDLSNDYLMAGIMLPLSVASVWLNIWLHNTYDKE